MPSPTCALLLEHILTDKPFGPLLRSPERSKHQAEWRGFIEELATLPRPGPDEAARFHGHWHVCHHYVRELVDDDPAVLAMLRVWLPPYAGPSLTLYRGENIDRMEAGRIGIAWTDEIETARTFAQGLNALGAGGALVQATAPASAIVAGPSKHSRYLGESEFTIDPQQLGPVKLLARFPPCL